MRLTEEQQAAYVEQGGVKCPFCGHHDLQGDSVDINEHFAAQDMT